MLVTVFSDIHIHPHKFGNEPDERLQHGLDVLDWALENPADACIFCGDLFHVRGRIAPRVFNKVYRRFVGDSLIRTNRKKIVLPGNHDAEMSESDFATECLSHIDDTHAPTHAGHYNFRDIAVFHIPFVSDVAELKEHIKNLADKADVYKSRGYKDDFTRILILHHGIDGIFPGVPDCGLRPEDLREESFDFIFLGDYHNHREIIPGKAWIVGAPMQHSFGDVGEKRGILTLDTDAKTVKFVENTFSPKFIIWNHNDKVVPDCRNNYLEVRADTVETLDKMVDSAKRRDARYVRPILLPSSTAPSVLPLTSSIDPNEMFSRWLEGNSSLSEEERESLFKLNKAILAEVGHI